MTRYADTLLATGEVIVLRARQHWLAVVRDALRPIVIVVIAIVLLFAAGQLPAIHDVLAYASLAGVIVGLLWIGLIVWGWSSQDYLVTNRRVIKVEGILNKHSADSSLEKINDAVLDQSVIGRIFGFGDLDILTANEDSVDRYKWLADAAGFKKEMLDQKNALEMDMRTVPAPPFRAAAPTVAPAAPQTAAASSPMSQDDVTGTLAKLADLRDRGAISAEEYEAKKAELLARL
ncbi:MAG: PH domain-containing protein [Chloroflexi bacterium]|nr:PH domain-containing protein [Chloroflexota bacterium]